MKTSIILISILNIIGCLEQKFLKKTEYFELFLSLITREVNLFNITLLFYVNHKFQNISYIN